MSATTTRKASGEPAPTDSNIGSGDSTPDVAPGNVTEALARITAEVGGLPKLTQAQRASMGIGPDVNRGDGVNYAFRGIDQISAKVQSLLGRYGVIIVPSSILDVRQREFSRGDPPRPWTDTTLIVEWTVYGPAGQASDDFVTAQSVGEGHDNSDKGVNKAFTSARKNLLINLFQIGDPSDDTDIDPTGARDTQSRGSVDIAVQAIVDQLAAITDPGRRAALKAEFVERFGMPPTITGSKVQAAAKWLPEALARTDLDTPKDPS
jgi:hypothetical protein